MVSAGVIVALAMCCVLAIVGAVLGVYFSKVACPDFGSKCTSSPAPGPKSPGPAPAPKSPGPAPGPAPASSTPGPAPAPSTPATYAGFVPGASGGGIVGIGTGSGTGSGIGSGSGTSTAPCASAGTACRPNPNDVCAAGFTPTRDGNNRKISNANAINPGMCSACCSKSGDGIDFTGRSPYNDPSSGNPYYCTYQHCKA